jgi:hypothetical protein
LYVQNTYLPASLSFFLLPFLPTALTFVLPTVLPS